MENKGIKGLKTLVENGLKTVFAELLALNDLFVKQSYELFIKLGCQHHAIGEFHKAWKKDKSTEKTVIVRIGKGTEAKEYDLKKKGDFFAWLKASGYIKDEYGQANKYIRCYLGRTSFDGVTPKDAYLLRLNDVNKASVFAASELSLPEYKKAYLKKVTEKPERKKTFTMRSDRKAITCAFFQSENHENGYLNENAVKVEMLNFLIGTLGIQAIHPTVWKSANESFEKYKATANMPEVIQTKNRHGKAKKAETLQSLAETIESEVLENVVS